MGKKTVVSIAHSGADLGKPAEYTRDQLALVKAMIKGIADEVFGIVGKNPLLDIALKLEETALSDDYFLSRKLYPNVDFYSGLIYQAMGFPIEMFTVLFAIPRTSGWLAHYRELLTQDQKIYRPRQLWIGAEERPYQPIEQRT